MRGARRTWSVRRSAARARQRRRWAFFGSLSVLGLARPDNGGAPLLVHLLGPTECQRVRSHLLRDGGAGCHVRAASDANRRHETGVGSDEGLVLDDRLVFAEPIVVARDGAGADIHPL